MEWNIRTKNVKGHQDRPKAAAAIYKNPGKLQMKNKNKNTLQKLSWEAQLNIQANALATQAKQELHPNIT
eukprot:8588240-Ditylum_brightwellii.AAC.1